MNNAYTFQNGTTVVNTTPHPITMQDVDGSLASIPSDTDFLVNAKAVETEVDSDLVTTEFVGCEEGETRLVAIEAWAKENGVERLRIVGSMLAAQAYPGRVVGMCPVPGFERVAPDEKRMRCDKFTTFQKKNGCAEAIRMLEKNNFVVLTRKEYDKMYWQSY